MHISQALATSSFSAAKPAAADEDGAEGPPKKRHHWHTLPYMGREVHIVPNQPAHATCDCSQQSRVRPLQACAIRTQFLFTVDTSLQVHHVAAMIKHKVGRSLAHVRHRWGCRHCASTSSAGRRDARFQQCIARALSYACCRPMHVSVCNAAGTSTDARRGRGVCMPNTAVATTCGCRGGDARTGRTHTGGGRVVVDIAARACDKRISFREHVLVTGHDAFALLSCMGMAHQSSGGCCWQSGARTAAGSAGRRRKGLPAAAGPRHPRRHRSL